MTRGDAMPAPQPLLIEAAGHACVAWWHAPSAGVDAQAAPSLPRGWLRGGALPLAVVLAGSWGEEDISGYDGQRALAIALAEGGLGTLRLEWPDMGDSSAATGAAGVADLLAAFDAAATQALALSGCTRLAFVGTRLGALLAAQAASAREDVVALAGLMPVASGRAFVREQRMLGAGIATPPAPPAVAGVSFDASQLPVALGGFTLPVRQVEALSALKWPTQAPAILQDALLLWPTESPGRPAADALARLGLRVREWAHVSLDDALLVAHRARLAPLAVAEIVRWLQERAGEGPAIDDGTRLEADTGTVLALSAADARRWMRLRVDGVAVRERVVRLGDPRDREPPSLVGVLGERDAAPTAERAPRRGLVLLSSGRERRVGPHRLWVPFARHRAALGDVVLRLDVAGIGDSVRRATPDAQQRPEHYDPRCQDDLARALEWLRREHGVREVTVMGLCSGAFHAWQAARDGLDVQQVVAVNPLIFHWVPGMSLEPEDNAFGQIHIAADAGRALLDPARWWKLLTGKAHVRVITAALAARARHAFRLRGRELARVLGWPLANDLAAELARTAERGVALDFVFSARDPGLTLLREETGRRGVRLVRDSLVKLCVIEHADHTFAGTGGRAELYARLDNLIQPVPSMIPPSAAAPSPSPAHPCGVGAPDTRVPDGPEVAR